MHGNGPTPEKMFINKFLLLKNSESIPKSTRNSLKYVKVCIVSEKGKQGDMGKDAKEFCQLVHRWPGSRE